MRDRETKGFPWGRIAEKVELSVQPFDADISRVRLLASIVLGTALVNLACAAPHAMRHRGGPAHGRVRVQLNKQIVSVPMDDYVRVVILSEFSPGPAEPVAVERMLELQAVVSRTYALFPRHRGQGFDFCASTHCQLYRSIRYEDRALGGRGRTCGSQHLWRCALVRPQAGAHRVPRRLRRTNERRSRRLERA